MVVTKTYTKSLNQEILDSYDKDSIVADTAYLAGPAQTALDLTKFSIASTAKANPNTKVVITAPRYALSDKDATTVRVSFDLTLGTATRTITKDITFAKSFNQNIIDGLSASNFSIADQTITHYGIGKDAVGRTDQFVCDTTGIEIDSISYVAPKVGSTTNIDRDATAYQAKIEIHLGKATATITKDITASLSYNRKILDSVGASDVNEKSSATEPTLSYPTPERTFAPAN